MCDQKTCLLCVCEVRAAADKKIFACCRAFLAAV